MDSSSGDTTTACTAVAMTLQHGPSTPPPSPQPAAVVLSPCAACKILRRRCVDRCVLAPYFPPTEPHKFATAHRVFGASNIIKLLQVCQQQQYSISRLAIAACCECARAINEASLNY
jgi:hypothetical protein